ncbi:MAG: hypothetical protein QOC85_2509, partial [Streptomyces sp.]|nr:hypothetical protein [Streptomyces sp.]
MRTRTLTLAAAAGAALLSTALLPSSSTAAPSGAKGPASAQEGTVSAASLLAKVTSCSQISNGK